MSITRLYRDDITETRYPTKEVRRSNVPYVAPGDFIGRLIANRLSMEQVAKIVMATDRYDLKKILYQRLMSSSNKSEQNVLALYPGLKAVPSTEMLVDILQSSTNRNSPMTTKQISARMYKDVKPKPRRYNKAVNRMLYNASKIQPLTILGRRGMVVRLDPVQGKQAPRWYWKDVDPDLPAKDTYFVDQYLGRRPRMDEDMPVLSDYF